MATLKRLALSVIRTDGNTQARASLDRDTVTEYAEALKVDQGKTNWPPIVVFQDKAGTMWLADGFHRVEAARVAGLQDLLADIHDGTRWDALKHALGANGTHGLRRTHSDVANAIRLAYENRKELGLPDVPSARVVGELLGISEHTATAQLAQFPAWATAPARTGADGKTRRLPPPPPPPPPPATTTLKLDDVERKYLAEQTPERQACVLKYMAQHPKVTLCQALRLAKDVTTPPPTPPPQPPTQPTAVAPTEQGLSQSGPVDEVGRQVPPEARGMWERRQEVQDVLTSLSRIRGWVRRLQDGIEDESDMLGAETNFSTLVAHLDQAYATLDTLKPYAVCPSCHGILGCRLCGKRRVVSKFRWDTVCSSEQKRQALAAAAVQHAQTP